jgi:hypothetical protein
MSQSLFRIALNFSLAGMGVKMAVFYFALPFEYGIFGYFLFILFALFFGMRKHMQKSGFLGFGDLLKTGMKIGAIYSAIISAFTYIYYRFIDYSYYPGKIAEKMLEAKEAGASEEQIAQAKETLEVMFSASSPVTLLGFLFTSFIYSLIWTLIFTKIPKARGTF